jgi:hypothetical protein
MRFAFIMPTVTTREVTIVEFTPTEAQALITAHLSELSPSDASLTGNQLSFAVSKDVQRKVLATAIPNLPASYGVAEVRNNPDVALRVTWTSAVTKS